MYTRSITEKIKHRFGKGKAIILVGPRQVGKTTLFNSILKEQNHLFLDADDPTTRELLKSPNKEQLKSIIGNYKIVFLDEAQRIENIGITLKLITDQFKDVQLLVSGSSSFDLGNHLNEPLTGRKWQFELLPISWSEFEDKVGYLVAEQNLENRLLYGFYPDVLNNKGDEIQILKELVNSYLYKDILSFANIRKPEVLENLVKALALQVGNTVNNNELAQLVGVDKNTIANYLDILEKGFVIFKLSSFSRNIRNEIKKNKKIYFYDNGIRNMVIGDFNPLNLRQDKGALWENFIISERRKYLKYSDSLNKMYFWRSNQKQEVDLVEENSNTLFGYEIKWNAKSSSRLPLTFTKNYKPKTKIIDRSNFRDLLI